MERLTEKDEQGNWCLKGVPWKCLYLGEVITATVFDKIYEALCKLMEYEDTGLTPEEIEQLKDKATISKMENVDWIPVEERLPEKGEIVLVTIECDCGKTLFTNGVMFGFYKKGWFVSDDIELKKLKVTAWQPLPEPYHPPAVED